MGEVLSFKKPTRLSARVRDVPFKDVAWQVAQFLSRHADDSLELQIRFQMNGCVRMIIGWPESEYLQLPYDAGPMTEFEETLRLYERGIAKDTEENPALVMFFKAEVRVPASWALASEESVKFPLKDEDFR